MRIRISRSTLRGLLATLCLLAFLGCCYALGNRLSPRDAMGHPLLLSPSVYRAERYRRAAVGWVSRMGTVDRLLTDVLAEEGGTDPAHLYALGRRAEEAVGESTAVLQDVVFTPPPAALVGLAEQVQAVAQAYLEAAQATARWVGAPEPEARYAALERLRTARGLRMELERSAWLDAR